MKTKEDKFWSNINVDLEHPENCWEWKSKSGTNEYAGSRWNNKSIGCHRKAYELWFRTSIPSDMFACHSCDNPPCCNPYHIFIGTRQDNVDDRERKGRNKMPHSKGEEHGQNKLTEQQVLDIVKLYKNSNHSYYTLAELFNVSFGNIRKIIKGQTWGWLTGVSE